MSAVNYSESNFARSVTELVNSVEYRRAVNEDDKTQIYRLRYSAYSREGALPPGAPEIFKDHYDDAPNVMTFGLYLDGRLSSSIRFHVASPKCDVLPARNVFSDYLQPRLEQGLTIIDSTRFVVDANAAQTYPHLPYATVRLSAIAGEHFNVDISLAAVRVEHQAFYKRLFGYKVVCGARPYPTLAKPISLMAVEYGGVRDAVKVRYPFFASTPDERNALFGDL